MTSADAKSLLKEYLTEQRLMRDDTKLTGKVTDFFMGSSTIITVSIQGYISLECHQDIFNFASNNGFCVEIIGEDGVWG